MQGAYLKQGGSQIASQNHSRSHPNSHSGADTRIRQQASQTSESTPEQPTAEAGKQLLGPREPFAPFLASLVTGWASEMHVRGGAL
jgi:hypothetical protein